jgi:CheY-like chemotaxis protein
MAARAADHEHEIDAFVQTTESDVRHAETALSHALARFEVSTEELQGLYAAHMKCSQPAVIVMDMTMPVLDGLEATRLIKAHESHS